MSIDSKVFKEALGDKYSTLDETTIEYLVGIVNDKDSDIEDVIASINPLIGQAIEDEAACNEICKQIVHKARGVSNGVMKHNEPSKILNAPVMMAILIEQQEGVVKQQLRSEMPSTTNVNATIEVGAVDGLDMTLSDKELREKVKSTKKQVRTDKRGVAREKRLALEREEILKSLNNRPIKLHEAVEDNQSRTKDIKLEGVTMALTSLELLNDINIVFSHGHKYGLVGRNGIGKTTFLKHLAAHAFPGIPKHLQILHIEQEIEGTKTSVLQTILQTDIEREDLIKELKFIQDYDAYLDKMATLSEEEKKVLEDAKKAEIEKLVAEGKQEEEDEFEVKKMNSNERAERLIEIYNRMQEIEADRAPARASSILAGLGFSPDMQILPTRNFSGGWRMRVSLAQALFISPDVLLLDEPTNHLDLHSVLWLEEYLKQWNKTLILVSHDRDFLNAVSTDIILFHSKSLFKYKGNFDAFEKQRSEQLKVQNKAHDAQQKKIGEMNVYIAKNRASAATAKMAQSRIKKLNKMVLVSEVANDPQFQFSIPEPDYLSGPLIQIIDVTFGFSPEKVLYKNISQSIDMESRVALVGNNGAGKSTLLKLILGDLQPMMGMVKLNPKARIARFTQHHVDQLELKKSPLQWFQDMYPKAKHQDIRKHLGGMGITGNLALQPIYSLSGGQKSRVAFANITWRNPHLILLDEPTNHLDMDTVDALIRALNKWTGGVLIVSHDEHLISTVCDTIWVCANNAIQVFPGDFDDYRSSLLKSNTLYIPSAK